MRIAIRTDASSQIGTGHFMRCLTLADGLTLVTRNVRDIKRTGVALLNPFSDQADVQV